VSILSSFSEDGVNDQKSLNAGGGGGGGEVVLVEEAPFSGPSQAQKRNCVICKFWLKSFS